VSIISLLMDLRFVVLSLYMVFSAFVMISSRDWSGLLSQVRNVGVNSLPAIPLTT
jgi:hypothetical protein